MKDTNPKRKG